MTDPTLPNPQSGKDKKNAPLPPLSESEKFEDIFKTVDIDATSQSDTLPPTEPSKIQEVLNTPEQLSAQESLSSEQTENPLPEKKNKTQAPAVTPPAQAPAVTPPAQAPAQEKTLLQDAPPAEPELTGIKDIGSYIAKAKENQSKRVTRLEAEDGTDLTKLPNIYAVVPHTKGDHKLIYTYDKAPRWLIDDPKQRTPGTSYIKNNELIYDVWVTMKKHPTLKNERNEPLDVWLIDTPDQLTQQLTSIAIGKGGGTNFSKPLIIAQPQKTPEVTKKVVGKTTQVAPKKEGGSPKQGAKDVISPDVKVPPSDTKAQAPVTSAPAQVPEPSSQAQAPEPSSQAQAPSGLKSEKPTWLSPEAKKTIKDTMAQTEKKQTLPPSLSKNFPGQKPAPEKQPPSTLKQPPKPNQEDQKPETNTSQVAPKKEAKQETKNSSTPQIQVPTQKISAPEPSKVVAPKATPTVVQAEKKSPETEVIPPVSAPVVTQAPQTKVVIVEERKTETPVDTKQVTTPATEKLPNEISLPEATAENQAVDEVLVIPTEHKETQWDIVDLDSLDTQAPTPPEEKITPPLDLESLDTQFAPHAKKVVHPKWSSVPIGMILRIVGVIIVVGMAWAMYTVMFPSVPQRPITNTTTTGTDLPLADDTPTLVDDEVSTGELPAQNTGTYGMPTKEEGEAAAKNTDQPSGSFTFDELAAKLTAQQKQAQTIANKAKLLNDKEAIKFSIVSIRKASEALKRIKEDPTITASELTDIATKIDLYLQEAELRIQ